MLKEGKSELNNIKNAKMDPNAPLSEQLLTYRDRLNPFFRAKNINVITEDQVVEGEELIQITSTPADNFV
jgi:hypothetical protein